MYSFSKPRCLVVLFISCKSGVYQCFLTDLSPQKQKHFDGLTKNFKTSDVNTHCGLATVFQTLAQMLLIE